MTERTKDILHKILAVASMALLVAIPIVSHSVFAEQPIVGFFLTVAMTILTSLGLTKVRPLADLGLGTLEQHKTLANILSTVGALLLVLRGMYGVQVPWVGLAIDIVLAVFGWAGVIVIKTPGSVAAAAVRDKTDTGLIDLGMMMVIAGIGFLIALVLSGSGCAPTDAYVAAVRIKGEASDTVRAAYGAWRTFDRKQQDDIVNRSTTREEVLKNTTDWWNNVESKVDNAFETADQALATYSEALKAANAVKQKDFTAAVSAVSKAVADLIGLLASVGVTIPSPTSNAGRLIVHYDVQGAYEPAKHVDATTAVKIARWHLQARMVSLLGLACRVDRFQPYCFTYAEVAQ